MSSYVIAKRHKIITKPTTAEPQFKGARGFFEKVPYIEDLP